jgi:hypothetical protein
MTSKPYPKPAHATGVREAPPPPKPKRPPPPERASDRGQIEKEIAGIIGWDVLMKMELTAVNELCRRWRAKKVTHAELLALRDEILAGSKIRPAAG